MNDKRRRVSVRDVMKTEFGLIEGSATIYEALLLMKKLRTSVLVVNKRHDSDEYGLLLVSDIARQVVALDRSPKRVNVYEVMTKPAVYIEPDMDIRYCSRLFARFDLVRALVVDDRKIIGTISPNLLVLDGLFFGIEPEA
ncbi:CBS domain-containing protein [Sedimenticola selenatireducens]|uniref:CBS domain-containing protein n=1 Tax=Sedimenticola selenatireducens TaxID=191960 RepID=A0A557SEJ3_9GAMM|nr:CBS domain-containing protein [Sedimenticola selenatireducens]TVO75803.1 CBS domain-containing protein [Sedimenticola selenatireducens]TVT63662.1 MAG: CBS domain-containing protein [Sedimenticola selenatireducens]